MFQFSRRVEYGLRILVQLAEGGERLHSARSVSDATRIPFAMVTKCLQHLHRRGICESVQGKYGGYRLACDPRRITLGRFMEVLEEDVAVAECLSKPESADCVLLSDCSLRQPMQELNQRVRHLLDELSLAEFIGGSDAEPERQAVGRDARS